MSILQVVKFYPLQVFKLSLRQLLVLAPAGFVSLQHIVDNANHLVGDNPSSCMSKFRFRLQVTATLAASVQVGSKASRC